jgi:hypothetical protein
MHLVRLYTRQKRYLEINSLVNKALSNIQKVYDCSSETDVTDIDEYINEHIKGIYITHINVEFIQEKFVPKHIIFFYTIITPLLSFYNFVKKAILQSMHSEE